MEITYISGNSTRNITFDLNNNNSENYHHDLYEEFDAVDNCNQRGYYHVDYTQVYAVTVCIIVCYVLVACLAVFGNSLVIWTVWRNPQMHTVTNYYIVNLAISDLLVASIVMPLKLLEYTADCTWHVFKSDGLCSVVYYLLPVFVFASVLTLAAISFERYYAIVHPLSAMKINSKSRVKKIIACTWIIPIIVATPFIYCQAFSFTIYSEYGVISREICNDRFNDIDIAIHGKDTNRLGDFRRGYFFFLFIVIYVIPSVTIMITCVKIAVSLLQPISVENSAFGRKDTNRRQEENKRKVAKMVIVIAITFIIFWSPQYIVSVVSQLQKKSFLRESNFIFTMLVTHFCGFINSCLNPFIYTAMSHKFRRSFYEILQRVFFCFTCLKLRVNGMYSMNSRRYTATMQHTLTDTDHNHIALSDNVSHLSNSNRRNKRYICSNGGLLQNDNNRHLSSRLQSNVVKKYIFRHNETSHLNKPSEGVTCPNV